jgi:hypothetical protein
MARFKRPKANKQTASARGAVPCLIVLIAGFSLIILVFYLSLKGG